MNITEELQIAYINGEVSALELIGSSIEEAELYDSFLRSNGLEKNEESAACFLEYEEETDLSSQYPLDGI